MFRLIAFVAVAALVAPVSAQDERCLYCYCKPIMSYEKCDPGIWFDYTPVPTPGGPTWETPAPTPLQLKPTSAPTTEPTEPATVCTFPQLYCDSKHDDNCLEGQVCDFRFKDVDPDTDVEYSYGCCSHKTVEPTKSPTATPKPTNFPTGAPVAPMCEYMQLYCDPKNPCRESQYCDYKFKATDPDTGDEFPSGCCKKSTPAPSPAPAIPSTCPACECPEGFEFMYEAEVEQQKALAMSQKGAASVVPVTAFAVAGAAVAIVGAAALLAFKNRRTASTPSTLTVTSSI
jgi:hypothetical protein